MLELLDLRERGERLEPTEARDRPRRRGHRPRDPRNASSSRATRCSSSSRCGSTAPTCASGDPRHRRGVRGGRTRHAAGAPRGARRADRAAPRTWPSGRSRPSGGTNATACASARSSGRSRRSAATCPGGRAVYPSTVRDDRRPRGRRGRRARSCVCTPPQPDGTIHAPVLYAAEACGRHVRGEDRRRAGRRRRWRTAPSRSRRWTGSSGPGNVYVTEAKRQVAGFVGIDGLAGPSRARDRGRRRRRRAHGGARPDRAGRARPRGAARSSSRPTRR